MNNPCMIFATIIKKLEYWFLHQFFVSLVIFCYPWAQSNFNVKKEKNNVQTEPTENMSTDLGQWGPHHNTATVLAAIWLLAITPLLQLSKLQCLMLLYFIRKDINLLKWKNLMTWKRTLSSGSFVLWSAGEVRIIWWLLTMNLTY